MESTLNSRTGARQATGLDLCLFGAAPDTGNMGVFALYLSTLAAIVQREPDARVTILDHGRGFRKQQVQVLGKTINVTMCGASHSRRLYRSDTLWNAWLRSWLGGLGSPLLARIRAANAVLDISAGDSFTDLYGPRRFAAETLPKRLALSQGTPLLLLPQTYGPFQHRRSRDIAAQLIRGAHMAWARDEDSYAALQELLGQDFDPARHRLGVDVAFGLPATPPYGSLPEPVRTWLDDREPVFGLNVSGLIYNQTERAKAQFGLRASYREVVRRLVERILTEPRARVVLVPHVLVPTGHPESDLDACRAVRDLITKHQDRLAVLEQQLDPCTTKWLIGRMDWFCGTRMHATIAALSQGVPAAAIAYSGKTRGVFASCGQEDSVADPRHQDTEATLDCVVRSWQERAQLQSVLAARLPGVMEQHAKQMDTILSTARAPLT